MRVNINALLDRHLARHQRHVDTVSGLRAMVRCETVARVTQGASVAFLLVWRSLTEVGDSLIQLLLDVVRLLQFNEHHSLLLF